MIAKAIGKSIARYNLTKGKCLFEDIDDIKQSVE